MSSYNINLDDWYADAVDLKAQGMSNRGIARTLFSNENLRNRLNTFFQQEEVIEDVYKRKAFYKEDLDVVLAATSVVRKETAEIIKQIEGGVSGNDYSNWEVKEKPSLGEVKKEPRILYYDIETSLAKSYHWGQWKQNLSVKQQIQESHMLSHAWAWNDGEVISSVLTPEEVLSQDDERIVYECWSLLDNCDVVVAHNGKRFDIKKVNGYFLKYGLPKPSSYKIIDTLEIAKKNFNLPFKSLEYLAKFLGVELKQDSGGIQTWIDCDRGCPKALETMRYYNEGDIVSLRDIHKRMKGWDNNGVNIALYNEDHDALCTHCGSDDVQVLTDKFAYTPSRKYQVYRCNSCKAVLRGNQQQGISNKLIRVL